MQRLSKFVLLAMIGAAAPAAHAQQPYPLRVPAENGTSDTVQVSVSYSLSIPLPDDNENAQSEALEKGRRLVYGMAASECKVLQDTIAASCKLERLNVQSNVQPSSRAHERIRVGASASYRIKLK